MYIKNVRQANERTAEQYEYRLSKLLVGGGNGGTSSPSVVADASSYWANFSLVLLLTLSSIRSTSEMHSVNSL